MNNFWLQIANLTLSIRTCPITKHVENHILEMKLKTWKNPVGHTIPKILVLLIRLSALRKTKASFGSQML